MESYQSICSEIRCIEQRQNHEIDLLSAYGILRLVTPECIAQFKEEHPDIRFQYREYPDQEVAATAGLRGRKRGLYRGGLGGEVLKFHLYGTVSD